MTDILEEREKRVQEGLIALRRIIEALEQDQFMGPGKIKIVSKEPNWHGYHLEIPIQSEDFVTWEEILHEGP